VSGEGRKEVPRGEGTIVSVPNKLRKAAFTLYHTSNSNLLLFIYAKVKLSFIHLRKTQNIKKWEKKTWKNLGYD
jgi:hypothetical protein